MQPLARKRLEYHCRAPILFAQLMPTGRTIAEVLLEDALFGMPEFSVDIRLQQAAYLRTRGQVDSSS
jgi:hypothetical protein